MGTWFGPGGHVRAVGVGLVAAGLGVWAMPASGPTLAGFIQALFSAVGVAAVARWLEGR